MPGSKIGERCIVGQNVLVSTGVTVGDGVKIQNNVSLYAGVVIKDDVFLGPSCVFTNVITPRAFIDRRGEFRQTVVKKGATIGANATIVCGNNIGRYAMVGAGAVVTKDVPDHALVIGTPARIIGYVCECGERLEEAGEATGEAAFCSRCAKKYRYTSNGILDY